MFASPWNARMRPGRGHAALSVLLLLIAIFFPLGAVPAAEESELPSSDAQVMHAFTESLKEGSERGIIEEQKKHLILFVMGIALLICLFATAGLGIAMAIYGKRVLLAHTLLAGLCVTLATVHAVAAVVWFWPF